MSEPTSGQIDNVMRESRLFPPSQKFSQQALIGSLVAYEQLYAESVVD
jgi:acetyl-CoA synthetase